MVYVFRRYAYDQRIDPSMPQLFLRYFSVCTQSELVCITVSNYGIYNLGMFGGRWCN
jgi:hypothetical protein